MEINKNAANSEKLLAALLEYLESNIKITEEMVKIFEKSNSDIAALSSDAMRMAYINVKNFIVKFDENG